MFKFLPELYTISVDADKRVSEILAEAKTKVAEYFGIPRYMLSVKYRIDELPAIYEVEIKRIGGYVFKYFKKIGKILGSFNPHANEIRIDYSNLSSYGYLRETIIHEMVHKAQKVLGKIGRLPRYLLEKEAYSVTKKLL